MVGGDARGAADGARCDERNLAAAGRDAKDLYATAFGDGCVLAEGEAADSPRARAQAGPSATMIFHDFAEEEELGSLGFRAAAIPGEFEAYRKIYRGYEPADARYLPTTAAT